jgi:hypothetical protein
VSTAGAGTTKITTRGGLGLLFAFVIAVTVAFALLAPAANAASDEGGAEGAAARIWTAKTDYVPSELVDINGSGFAAGETVELFVDDDQTKSWTHSATVTADENGKFYYEFRLPDWFVAVYTVTATGDQGTEAVTEFDDSIAQGSFGTNHNTGNTELTISAPVAAVGDILVAHLVATDSVSNVRFCPVQTGWNTNTAAPNNLLFRDSQNKIVSQVFWRAATAANASAVSYNFNFRTATNCTGSNLSLGASGGITAFSGVDTTTPIDAAGGTGGTNSAASGDAPSVTASTANTHVLRFFGLFKNASIGPAPEPPRIYSINSSSGKERAAAAFGAAQAAAGATGTFTGTFGSTGEWVAQTVALKMAVPTVSPTSVSDVSGSGTYGGAATLTAKLTSGGSELSDKMISFTLNGDTVGTAETDANGVATLTGVSLAGLNAGTHTNAVGASFAGDGDYESSDGSGDLVVTAATVTVTPDSGQSKAFGDPDPTLTYTLSETVDVTGALDRDPGEDVGSYAIGLGTLAAASSNYTLVLDEETVYFAITAATVTVTPDSGQSKVAGADDPTLTFTNDGGLAASAFSGALGRAPGEDPGTYAINLGTLTAGSNYSLVLSETVVYFTITPACGLTAAVQAPFKDNQRNIVKAGNVVPVKVRVSDCNGNPVTNRKLEIRLVQGVLDPSDTSDGSAALVESVSNADTTGVMRVSDSQYIYNLSTKGLTNNVDYTIVIKDTTSVAWASAPRFTTAVLRTQK